ncbi:MAG: hypothetical protein R6V72_17565 [Cyclobacterium sp.]|uniref:hypothetical protein n=1 Tax=unclassified Cyclobacterium TaxID=2615055 RepID=UPI0013D214E1|nr:hypothetical protein [Cyclobacterium sp. SYSU L10401]
MSFSLQVKQVSQKAFLVDEGNGQPVMPIISSKKYVFAGKGFGVGALKRVIARLQFVALTAGQLYGELRWSKRLIIYP